MKRIMIDDNQYVKAAVNLKEAWRKNNNTQCGLKQLESYTVSSFGTAKPPK